MLYSKTCSVCETKFQTDLSVKKYCSKECSKIAKIGCGKKSIIRRRKESNKINSCNCCRKKFKSYFFNSERQRFCSRQCKDDHHKDIKLQNLREQADLSPKPCLHCEEIFTPKYGSNTGRQSYCSNLCKKEYHKAENRRKSAEIRANTIRTCPICDVQFNPKKTLKEIYCSKQCRQTIGKRVYGMMDRCYKQIGQEKQNQSHKVLGYSPAELLAYLQSFPDWDTLKHQKWHLDHKFPIIAFIHKGINCLKNGNYDVGKFEKWFSFELV